jgi:photosystem I P700 chlorophyll a apoprotein A2
MRSGTVSFSDTLTKSLHLQLSLCLAFLGVICSVAAQHIYSIRPYVFLDRDYVTQAALYTHHQYIGGFLSVWAFAHSGIFMVRDYNPRMNRDNILYRIHEEKELIISNLSWLSLFLGFQTLGLYVHHDVCVVFGAPESQVLFEPVLAKYIQSNVGLRDSHIPSVCPRVGAESQFEAFVIDFGMVSVFNLQFSIGFFKCL